MIVWSALLPWKPPSSNHSYLRSHNGRMFMPKEVKEYKENVAQFARYTYSGPVLTEDLAIEVIFIIADNRRRDISNHHKALFDALEGVIYEDDKQLSDIRLMKRRGDKFGVEVKIFKQET